jgi:hypothetical protein
MIPSIIILYNITQSNTDKNKPSVVKLNVVRDEEEKYKDKHQCRYY